ncbi:MAG: hypothetical protein RBR93_11870 [Aliarcobacter butzleri]|nr:hypothetical protein [Aliarcobacter butzleri]
MHDNFQYMIINNNKEIISSSKNYKNIFDLEKYLEESSVIDFENSRYRICKVINTKGTIYAYSNSKIFLKSSKQFRLHLNTLNNFLENLNDLKKDVVEVATKQVKILVHNLVSINAKNLQEIYNILPQEKLASSIPDKLKFVSNVIKSNPDKVALVLLKLMKNNIAMKTEFSVFNKLYQSNPKLSLKSHNVHRVLMNIFYSFFPDFTDKKIYVNVERCSYKAYFDYESIYVAFFHIMEISQTFFHSFHF